MIFYCPDGMFCCITSMNMRGGGTSWYFTPVSVKASFISREHSLSNMCILGASPCRFNILNVASQVAVILPMCLLCIGTRSILLVS